MGKTSKPLTILAMDYLEEREELKVLGTQGHRIVTIDDIVHGVVLEEEIDLVLGYKAWRMTPDLLKYLHLSIRAARGQKYPKKGGTSA